MSWLPPTVVALPVARARRIAIAAQGLAAPRPAAPGMRHLSAAVARMGLLQMDSVNVLVRSHYLPLFSRLGPYDRSLLERASGVAPRRLVEYWAHEASLVPPETHRLLRWRMRQADEKSWGGMRRVADDHPDVVAAVLAEVAAHHRPLTTSQLEAALAHDAPRIKDELGLELVAGQAGARVPLLGRRGHLGRADHAVRAPLHAARAGAAARGRRGAGPRRPRGVRRAGPHRRACPRRRQRAVPARLLPAAPRRTRARPSRRWSTWAS